MCECVPCGLIRCAGVMPLSPLRAAHAAYSPCPGCGHHGENRIFWLEPIDPVPPVSKERLQ